MNIQPGPGVDHVGSAIDLSAFEAASFDEVYASHVLEHLAYQTELVSALAEMRRVLKPEGLLRISVPDLDVLCRLITRPDLVLEDRFQVMRMLFGGQTDQHDFHKVGLNWDFLANYLFHAGFNRARRVEEFGLFDDTSCLRMFDTLISLNVEAWTSTIRQA